MIRFFVISSICVAFLLCSRIDLVPNQSKIDNSVVAGHILKNFFRKYFSDEQIFVSLTISPPDRERNHMQDDLVTHLVINLTKAGFSYNILNKLGGNTRDNWKDFHLIVVDGSKQLQ